MSSMEARGRYRRGRDEDGKKILYVTEFLNGINRENPGFDQVYLNITRLNFCSR